MSNLWGDLYDLLREDDEPVGKSRPSTFDPTSAAEQRKKASYLAPEEMWSYSHPPTIVKLDRSLCPYCHGHTKDDDRGNCIACGGPK
jgi:hypothetical protein